MMNKLQIEAYDYYKSKEPRTIFLFLIKDHYEAYAEDAEIVNSILHVPVDNEIACISTANILDNVEVLFQSGFKTKLIAARNNEGKLDIPNISAIMDDKANDY